MSKNNPGVLFDASSSWNGYNHQGKLAILFAIKEILKVYDRTKTRDENINILKSIFLEIEYLEDFSIGKHEEERDEYLYVHQVKNHATSLASNYDSALLGLIYHVIEMPQISNAYLHTTTEISFNGDSLNDYIKELCKRPAELLDILAKIDEYEKDELKKKKLYEKKKGRPSAFLSELKIALLESDKTQTEINDKNVDEALRKLKEKTQEKIDSLSALSDEQISKISIYEYDIENAKQPYCTVDCIGNLIRKEIETSIKILGLEPLWLGKRFIGNRYLYLLGKLDEHVIERDLHYPLYNRKGKDRKVYLDTVFEWLTNNEIENDDDFFYQYRIKEVFFKLTLQFCAHCKEKDCEKCNVVSAINKIGEMSHKEMSEFLRLTNPSNKEGLSVLSIAKYLNQDTIANPFLLGIKTIEDKFIEEEKAIIYADQETKQYVLTTLVLNEMLEDISDICSDIVSNKELYELMMDNNFFISRNISCKSIFDENKRVGKKAIDVDEADPKNKEHIMHMQDVGIVKLSDFELMIK